MHVSLVSLWQWGWDFSKHTTLMCSYYLVLIWMSSFSPNNHPPVNITGTPCCVTHYTTLLQSSSKTCPSSSSSSFFSCFVQPLKVVNRKHPPRDDWNNMSSQGEQEGDRSSQDMDQDICIKVSWLKKPKCHDQEWSVSSGICWSGQFCQKN